MAVAVLLYTAGCNAEESCISVRLSPGRINSPSLSTMSITCSIPAVGKSSSTVTTHPRNAVCLRECSDSGEDILEP